MAMNNNGDVTSDAIPGLSEGTTAKNNYDTVDLDPITPQDSTNASERRISSPRARRTSAASRGSAGRSSVTSAESGSTNFLRRASDLVLKRFSTTENRQSTSSIPSLPGVDFWTRMANDDGCWDDVKDDDDFVHEQFSFKLLYLRLQFSLKQGYQTVVSHPYIGFAALLCLFALLAVSLATTVLLANQYKETKISNAQDVAMDTGLWFRNQVDKVIFPLFALGNFVKEMPIFHDLPFLIGKGGEPGSAPYINSTVITHRNVSGICDNVTKMNEFNRIAKSIKDDANMDGVLVSMDIAPASVVCFEYPLLNTEDFTPPLYLNNTGAIGLDLLKDPKQRSWASDTLPSFRPVVAGPRTLVQCPDCPPAVRMAFIAMMPIKMPPEMGYNITADDGTSYSVYGFASAIINWERLLNRSDIFQRFESRGMQFELYKVDHNFNTATNQYEDMTSVLAKSAGADRIGESNFFNVSLPTTNNNWTIGVAYDDGVEAPWFQWALALSIVLSVALSSLLLVILIEKQQRRELLRQIIPVKAIKRLQQKRVVVDKYNIVTLFQSDIIDFTAISAEMTPIRVMQMLNSFYNGVDKLAIKHGVYKIKIIGDAYVCVAGCPDVSSGPDGAERIALFALDMMEFTTNFRTEEGAEISVRAGIHSGELVAGIVGFLRPQYTVFGDTSTVASRMESSSKRMKIQCSDVTWRLLQDAPHYNFMFQEAKEQVQMEDGRIKGKTWFIEGANLLGKKDIISK